MIELDAWSRQNGGCNLVASCNILETSTWASGRVTSSSSKPSLIGSFTNSNSTGLPQLSNSALTFHDGSLGNRAPLTQTRRSPTSKPADSGASDTTGTPFASMTENPSASPSKVTTGPPHWGLILIGGGPRAGGGAFLRSRAAGHFWLFQGWWKAGLLGAPEAAGRYVRDRCAACALPATVARPCLRRATTGVPRSRYRVWKPARGVHAREAPGSRSRGGRRVRAFLAANPNVSL